MPQKYDNTNSGAIFKNKYKESDKHPDLTGPLNVDGVEYNIAAWSNVSDAQGKYLSIKISKKEDKESKGSSVPASGSTDEPF
jgi:uncharacterized protein (DUF736 family)|tara:strand:- start:261 stop:506 length:246 start_codon:yes stop_codon:yes gene_type:complete